MKNRKLSTKTSLEIERLAPDISSGLSSIDVESRIKAELTNTTTKKYSKSYLSIFCGNIFSVFNLMGLIVLIALICVKAPLSNFFFVFFYVSNIFIGIIQEIRAKKCVEKLSLLARKDVLVIRDGEKIKIPSNQIVLDDLIILGFGDQIPTDSILVDGSVKVNEALLTGESTPINKGLGDLLLAGSFIVSGSCIVRAEKVGKNNYVEILSAKARQYKKPKSEIMNSINLIIKVIGSIIITISTAFMLKSTLIFKAPIEEAILSTSTIVIGMIPAGMFLLVSVTLAVGIIKLARHNTLIQDLYSLEMLARVDTICFDKTGTITDGKMCVDNVITLSNDTLEDITNIVSSMSYVLHDENMTAIALKNRFGDQNVFKAVEKMNFSSEKKLSAVSFSNGLTYALGAPEFVLNAENYSKIKEIVEDNAKKGYRVLLLAIANGKIVGDDVPTNFEQVALIILADNIRADAVKTVAWFKENGVQIKVISGDNPVTVSEVSRRVGIDNYDKYISLEGLTDQEVFDAATEYTIFGRVSPEQKAILVKALKEAGHVTAMTGDGVNDILALKEADCAVSVASGSQAARNVSHIILLDNNFNSMPKVVREGRRVINNVESSSSLFLMKTAFTMIMSILALCLPYMKTYPFHLPHMILIEIFVIGLPAFFLSLQPNDRKVEGKFIYQLFKKSLPSGILMIFNVAVIEILKLVYHNFPSEIFTTLSVASITIAGLINLFVICLPFNKYRTILFSISSSIVVFVLVYAILFGLPVLELAELTSFNGSPHPTLILFAIVVVNLPIRLFLKKQFDKINFTKITNKIFK